MGEVRQHPSFSNGLCLFKSLKKITVLTLEKRKVQEDEEPRGDKVEITG